MPKNGTNLDRLILDEARVVLLRDGYTSLSMRRIADKVGCTATSIYLYFENKDALIHALIDEGMDSLHASLTAAAQGASDPLSRLEALCRAYLRFGLENQEYYEVMFMLHPKHMERYPAEKYRRARRNLELIQGTLAQAQGKPNAAGADVLIDATLIWTALHGTVSTLIAGRSDAGIDQAQLLEGAVRHAMRMADGDSRNTKIA